MQEIKFFVFGNNQHLCFNYSRESLEFFAEKPYGMAYYKLMAIYPFVNVIFSLVALVLYCRSIKSDCISRTRTLFYLLINLCFWDLCFQLTMGINQALIYRMESGLFIATSKNLISIYTSLLPISIVAVTWCHISRNFSILLIAIMRYDMICKSKDRGSLVSSYQLKRKIVFIAFVPLVISFPRCFEFSYHICLPKLQLFYIQPLLLTNPIYFWIYSGLFLCVSQSIIPSLILLIITIKLVQTICLHNKVRKISLNKPSLASKKLRLCRSDILIISLCAMFWVCELPGSLKMLDTMSDKLQELGWFMNFMPCLDSTFNFIIYIAAYYLGTFAPIRNSDESRTFPVSSTFKLEGPYLMQRIKMRKHGSI